MNRFIRTAAMLLVLGIPSVAHAQELTVVAASHHTQEYDYNVNSAATSNTNCNVYSSSVNCNTTSYGGGTETRAVYTLTEVVRSSDGIQYTLSRTARWRWSSTDWLNDGESFDAEIKGKHMYIKCRKGGNQGKRETLKYDILDIRPVPH
jgi:hypothetical protein